MRYRFVPSKIVHDAVMRFASTRDLINTDPLEINLIAILRPGSGLLVLDFILLVCGTSYRQSQ
jgi:hypothetical protein